MWSFSLDYIAELNNAWGWATNTNLAFPVTFFGVVSLDIMIWFFLWVFLIIIFYEHFVDRERVRYVSSNAKWVGIVGVFFAFCIVAVSKLWPASLLFDYAYFFIGMCMLALSIGIVIKNPRLLPKILEIIPFFIVLYLTFELVALRLDLWSFPGQYVGLVSIFDFVFPIEELLIWVVASSAIAASYYEFCVDDER